MYSVTYLIGTHMHLVYHLYLSMACYHAVGTMDGGPRCMVGFVSTGFGLYLHTSGFT